MDIKSLQGGVSLPPTLPTGKGGGEPAIRQPKAAAPPTPIPGSGAENNNAYFEKVKQASKAMQNYYPLSDTTFSIYKDQTGQYITRFVNDRTGEVTYIPEPDVLAFLEKKRAMRQANLDVMA